MLNNSTMSALIKMPLVSAYGQVLYLSLQDSLITGPRDSDSYSTDSTPTTWLFSARQLFYLVPCGARIAIHPSLQKSNW